MTTLSVKKVFLISIQSELTVLQLEAISLVLSLVASEKRLTPRILHFSAGFFLYNPESNCIVVAEQDHTRISIFSCGFSYLLVLLGNTFFPTLMFLSSWLGHPGLVLFGIFPPAYPAEVSMQFNQGSWNLTLLLSFLNLQVSVWFHSFCSPLLSLLGSNFIIYCICILVESGFSIHKDFIVLLSPYYIKYNILYYTLYSLSCTAPYPHLYILFCHSW